MASESQEVASTYDAVASRYEEWPWQEFWRRNERPLLERIMATERFISTSLDVGTGIGAYSDLYRLRASRIVGLDISLGMLTRFVYHHPRDFCVMGNATSLPFQDAKIGRITANRVLSHIRLLHPFFKEAYRVLEPSQTLIVSDLDADHSYDRISFSTLPGPAVPPLKPCRHSIQELIRAARYNNFELDQELRIRHRELAWHPPSNQLTSLERASDRNIFYVLVFRKH
jgi:ubiquinone/menaquinone biosynthesis C-methylase UbiE